MKNMISIITISIFAFTFSQVAFCRSYSFNEDLTMLGQHAKVVSVTADSGTPTDMAADSGSAPAAATASKDGVKIIDVESDDGRQGHRGVYVGDTLVQRHPPNSFDEGSVQSWKNKAGEVIAVTYKDNSNYRANGFSTDIPNSANISKVLDEGDKVRIVWKDGSETKSCVVPNLKSRGPNPPSRSTEISSSVYDDKKDDDSGKNDDGNDEDGSDVGNEDNSDKGTSTDDNEGGASTDDDKGSKEDSEDNEGNKGKDPENNTGPITPAPTKEDILEPGNSYGFDAILDDATILSIVGEESGKIKGKYNQDGLAINDWGVAIGKSNSCTITHSGGIDGYQSSTHYWLTQPSIRSAVEKAASTTRTELEAERDKRHELAMAQWRSNQGGGSHSEDGPRATSNNRPSSISAGSSVGQGSNYMSGS